MDSDKGGLSSAEQQRQTIAKLARDKVFSAYQTSPTPITSNSRSSSPVLSSDWQKYHAAWQEYYQNYYSNYYANAARDYIETEKLKKARAKEDERQALANIKIPTDAGTALVSGPTEEEYNEVVYNSVSASLKERLQKYAIASAKRSRRARHLIPIFAGLGVVLFFLFLQYNRVIFAPIAAYVSPGNSSTDSIAELDSTILHTPGPEPKLLIPKLNVDVPVAFNINNDEKTVMQAMNHGVAHFMIPGANAFPGQIGNLVITGHSAGDIYSSNPYKFIFSGLERLREKDTIYINYNSVRYTYTVTNKTVVNPSEVNKLIYETDKPVLTLITCTPLGTAQKRLLVTAEQINASDGSIAKKPNHNSQNPTKNPATVLPSNEPSFFERIWRSLNGR